MPKKQKPQEWVPWELRRTNPDIFYFKEDLRIPSSLLPLLVYRGFFDKEYGSCEGWLTKKFRSNKWFPAPALQAHDFTHYYANTHIVLGICAGEAKWQLGGRLGISTILEKGDVMVIPAGVALRCIESDADFKMVGACSVNVVPELRGNKPGNPNQADPIIANIAIPDNDPILGPGEGLLTIWQPAETYLR
ncbi:cupin domain-containing protein [Niabella hirudinis]|uniref:cupin domain-containing protein n=1 Tax=Niabella hirudinis TaxID=1285929 RepID=UPI003EC0FFC4